VPAKGDTERVDVTDLDADPLCQLSRWLDEARAAGQPMPEAMTIATATSDGVPSPGTRDRAGGAGQRGRSRRVLEDPRSRRPPQRGRLKAKPRPRQPDGPGNAGPGHRTAASGGADLPRPPRWGGFRVLPSRVEFWQESSDGLHDRIRYRPQGTGWITERLSP
jgi:pyridoxamine 5'-phosphate oxidase